MAIKLLLREGESIDPAFMGVLHLICVDQSKFPSTWDAKCGIRITWGQSRKIRSWDVELREQRKPIDPGEHLRHLFSLTAGHPPPDRIGRTLARMLCPQLPASRIIPFRNSNISGIQSLRKVHWLPSRNSSSVAID